MASKRKKKRAWKARWRQMKRTGLQRLGAMSLFVLLLLVLLAILTYRLVNYRQTLQEEQQYWAQVHHEKEGFLKAIAPVCQRMQRQYGVLASISMAQAALESDYGRSQLGAEYNNLYGVKADPADPHHVMMPTLEYIDGEWLEVEEPFKVYPSWEESIHEHAQLLTYGTSWDPNFYSQVIQAESPQGQAQALQEAGYATDPDYANKLLGIIEEWDLDQYDQPNAGGD